MAMPVDNGMSTLMDKYKRYQDHSQKVSLLMLEFLKIPEESKLMVWREELLKLVNELDRRHVDLYCELIKIQKDISFSFPNSKLQI
jgi:hypothetical protein